MNILRDIGLTKWSNLFLSVEITKPFNDIYVNNINESVDVLGNGFQEAYSYKQDCEVTFKDLKGESFVICVMLNYSNIEVEYDIKKNQKLVYECIQEVEEDLTEYFFGFFDQTSDKLGKQKITKFSY